MCNSCETRRKIKFYNSRSSAAHWFNFEKKNWRGAYFKFRVQERRLIEGSAYSREGAYSVKYGNSMSEPARPRVRAMGGVLS